MILVIVEITISDSPEIWITLIEHFQLSLVIRDLRFGVVNADKTHQIVLIYITL